MLWLVILLISIIIILLSRLFFINKEIRNITNQLNKYNEFKTRKKLDINLINKDVELLAESINKHMEISKQLQINQVNTEEELKNMIASISHDLRTPLTSIRGYLQMLKKPFISDEKKRRYIDISDKRAKDLQVLLNEFFMLSVIEATEYSIKLEKINLKEILVDVITSFYEEFNNKNIEPEIKICDELVNVLGDYSSTKRVIENLMINISKHSNGNVKVSLKIYDEIAELTIIDSVDNLTESQGEQLFNKFYKGDESRNTNSTGLGLAIVKELMIKMNGSVSSKVKSGRLYIKCCWNLI